MDKYSIITIIALIVITAPVLYGIWGIYSVEQIQLITPNESFSYFEMANDEQINLCNPLPFFVSFQSMNVEILYKGDVKGVFKIGPTTLEPYTSKTFELNFSSNSFSESQYLFMHMDGQFDGEVPIRLNPNEMEIKITLDSRIIGIIPFQTIITQSAFEFTNKMNEEPLCD